MAMIHILDTEGRPHLVHSSIFDGMKRYSVDEKRPARATGSWPDVWARVDEPGLVAKERDE